MQFFERQREARARTWQLLGLFALTVVLLVLAINGGLALLWRLLSPWPAYPSYFFQVNTSLVLLFVLGGWWVETSQMALGGAALAKRMGARPAQPQDSHGIDSAETRYARIVQELAIASNLPVPQAWVLPRAWAINAFAAGWDEDDAVVTVTEGALEWLSRDELMGLVAHELSHIREGDARLNMRLSGMVFGLEMIYTMGQSWAESGDDGQPSALAPLGWVLQALGWCGYLAGRMLRAGVLREREYLADARAVQFTRSKDGIGGVLRKVLTQAESVNEAAVAMGRSFHPAISHMLLVQEVTGSQAGMLATHPPLPERIKRIYGRSMPALPLPVNFPDCAASP